MAQADAIEASARELISKLPEEVPVEEQEARKGGNCYHIGYHSFPFLSFLVLSSYLFQLEVPYFNYVSELFEEVDLDTFLKEDQATLTRRGKQSVACVVREL